MIWLMIILVSGLSWADGGCLQSARLNEAITRELKIPCEKFPQLVPVDELDVELYEDLILVSEDVDRLSVLEDIRFEGDDSSWTPYSIKLRGNINFPALTSFEAYYVIRSIDTTQGKLLFHKLSEFHSVYFEGLLDLISAGVFAKSSLGIDVQEGITLDLDFKDLFFTHSIKINGARSIRNLVVTKDVTYLTIEGPENAFTSVSNFVYTSGDSLDLKNVKFEDFHSPFRFLDGYRLELENIQVDKPFVTSDSTFSSLTLRNSQITLPGPEVLSQTRSFALENSTLNGAVIPTNHPNLSHFAIHNSIVTIESFPQSKTLYELQVTGKVTILDPTSPIQVYERTKGITIAVPGLERVNIFLGNPKVLEAINVLDSPGARITFLNLEYLGLVPKYLRVLVDRKAEALELRKVLKLKSVGFISE